MTENSVPTFDKCAIVVDEALPTGLAMNAAAVLALSLGHAYGASIIGDDVKDRDGQVHRGITAANVPVLKAGAGALGKIVEAAVADAEVYLVDFTAVAQSARDYGDYTAAMAEIASTGHAYVGVAVAGPKKAVNKLTGSLPLYR